MKRSMFVPALLIASIMQAQSPATKDLPKLNYEYALNDPLNARIYTLKNGLKVYMSVYKNAPRIQTYIAVRAGSKNDPPDATGLAHYLEHMLFKGTDVFGTRDFKKESAELKKIEDLYETYRKTTDEPARKKLYHQIDSISGVAAKYSIPNEYDRMLASIGADNTNAYTSFDQTVYTNDIPSNQLSNWLKIESERFRNPVLRLFHTELEAVYEEKNRGLDNDDSKVWEAVFAGLFRNHTYGTQTTIGTIQHLKNPSMTEISKYYHKHYAPNNMAIVMSGDFNPDKAILEVEKYFGGYKSQPLEPYKFQPEPPATGKVKKEVLGPTPANVSIAWRFAGDGSTEADMCNLVSGVLYNKTAGLMDLNLNQAQKVLSSSAFFYPLKDYSMLAFSGEPKEGQLLEDVEQLIISQIDLLKKGDFPDWLLDAVKTDLRLKRTKELENNSTRADAMLNAFVSDIRWQNYSDMPDRISKITKADLVKFANDKLNTDNYVVVYKRTGSDTTVEKVTKPEITPVDVDRSKASAFVTNIEKSTPAPIQPKFIDYQKDIKKGATASGVPLLYNRNTENKLFELYYHYDMGGNSDKVLPVAMRYVPYLATENLTAAQVQQEFYKLGCSFNVFSDAENTWVSLSGLSDNYEAAVKLFEQLLSKPVVEEKVLKGLVGDIIKERNDNKLQKRLILSKAMSNYARYGARNPFSNVLKDEELYRLTPQQVAQQIMALLVYEHRTLYYGPAAFETVLASLNANHKVGQLKPAPAPAIFEEKQLDNSVLVVDYDMKQAEIVMLTNGGAYDPKMVPVIRLYNEYFGAGMSSVLFQDLRETKALAYSTYSRYNEPNRLTKKYYNMSYIGSQADKLSEAMAGLSGLLKDMPNSEGSFAAAKELILQEMRTQRITRSGILFNYIQAQQLGLKDDIRKDIYSKVQGFKFDDVKNFHAQNIKGKPTTVLVLGNKSRLDMKVLEQYGKVRFLTLEEVFGY